MAGHSRVFAEPGDAGARYLSEQIALAITQRASGEDVRDVRETLTLALSLFSPA